MMKSMAILELKASDKAVRDYLDNIEEQYVTYFKTHTKGNPPESAVEPAFLSLLRHCSKKVSWNFVPKKPLPNGNVPDGTFLEPTSGILPMGYMESKDDDDDLDKEIHEKLEIKKYPRFNILFWQPKRVVLIQQTKVRDEIIKDNPAMFVSVLKDFFNYEHFDRKSWNEAIKTFDEQMPVLAKGLLGKIEESEKENKQFVSEFEKFFSLCKSSINPNIGESAIKEMIVQHLLTERILESIFDLKRFAVENAVASQLDILIKSMESKHFTRSGFLGSLDHFYDAIIKAADKLEDFKTKQVFLNDIFERFFQGWAIKSADRLGIVYTPQSVVDFMVKSVDEILKNEFGKKHGLGSENVHIIDPFVGTGNFIVNVIDKIKPTKLEHKYLNELHCNEISLMPYYIANINIEHAYFEAMGERKEFPGICFADTFQMYEDEAKQKEEEKKPKLINPYMNEENSERVLNQRSKEIFVVISNPPYNAHQADEMDNNKNRKYQELEKSIKQTYSKDSKATLKNKLMDPYVKALKWATDRIGDEGIVAMITNNSFIDDIPFDGMRKHLEKDFDKVYILDLGGNVRKNPKLSGTTHNVFGIQVGVSINIFIKNKNQPPYPPSKGGLKDDEKNPFLKGVASDKIGCGGLTTSAGKEEQVNIHYARVDEYWKKGQKYEFLNHAKKLQNIEWKKLTPNKNHTWLTDGIADDFEDYPLMGDKELKGTKGCNALFNSFSCGIITSRDIWVYNFDKKKLSENVELHISSYNGDLKKWQQNKDKKKLEIDDFVLSDEKKIKWTDRLKNAIMTQRFLETDSCKIRHAQYRPYKRMFVYFDDLLNQRRFQQHHLFPNKGSEDENITINTTTHSQVPFVCSVAKSIVDFAINGRTTQCFPFYTYNEDGAGRKENITDATLERFREYYKNQQPPNPPSKGGLDSEKPTYKGGQRADEKDPLCKGVKSVASTDLGGSDPPCHFSNDIPPYKGGQKPIKQITKWDIFYYIYAMLHHPDYRDDFKENLKRSLPRIPFAPDFNSVSEIGKKLADIHLNYESAEIYDLDEIVDNKEFPNIRFRVEKMKLKKDEGILVYNNAITFTGIPKEVFDYKLGNRSALEWIVDQYRVKIDKRSGITQDPNNFDGNEKYIFELIGKIVTVSLETVKLVSKLSKLPYK
jgi:predicted helicase